MHKKYCIYISLLLTVSALLINNIVSTHGSMFSNSVEVYDNVEEDINYNIQYLQSIEFLISEMRLNLEKIVYTSNGNLNIGMLVLDKRHIYEIIDTLDRNLFNVISYTCTSENDGKFIYEIEIGVKS